MAQSETNFVHAADLSELKEEGRKLINKNGQAIALFYHEGDVQAVDNRCPHMGFPLTEGTVEDGILTCHWHHARFELACGDTFDPWADDLPTYPVKVEDGKVLVKPKQQRDKPPAEHWQDRLETGLEENLRLVLAKSAIGLEQSNVDYTVPFRKGIAFGTEYRQDGWGRGLTIHSLLANLRPDLQEKDRKRAMYIGLNRVANNTSGEPPKFEQPAFENKNLSKTRLKSWFRDNVDVRDRDGAERVLRTAIQDLTEEEVADILFTTATDHIYINTGHTLDFINKAFESLDHIGWDHADQVLPSLVPSLTDADWGEENSQWRQPIDIAELLFDTYDELPALIDAGKSQSWDEPDSFIDTLLSDDPHAIVDTLREAIRNGATPAELAKRVAYAAAIRIAQFSTGNEFSDWDTVHHTFTYANAVHQATQRTEAWELYRGVFDAAMNVYLDRFLNTPPAQ
ncbi:MAG: Rieske (2Fe-2S) protein, partial [Halobacteriaceae archaeon]